LKLSKPESGLFEDKEILFDNLMKFIMCIFVSKVC
jgi:hypothetical protein